MLALEKDNAMLPCLFFSKTLNNYQKNKKIIFKELIAITQALKKFPFLRFKRFTLHVDNQSLVRLIANNSETTLINNAIDILQQFNFDIIYERNNQFADFLSRSKPSINQLSIKEEQQVILGKSIVNDLTSRNSRSFSR